MSISSPTSNECGSAVAKPVPAEVVQREHMWDELLSNNPEILHSIVGDLVKLLSAKGCAGRRPMPPAPTFDQLIDLLTPSRFTLDPFPVAATELVKGDARELARIIDAPLAEAKALLAGRKPVSVGQMRTIAAEYGFAPTFFVEWRAWRLGKLFGAALAADAAASVMLVRRLVAAAGPR